MATGWEVEGGQARLARWLPRLGLKVGQLQPGSRHVRRSRTLAAEAARWSRLQEGRGKKKPLFVFTETCVTFKSDLSASLPRI